MGSDKALLPLFSCGPPLLAIVLERLSGVADDVMIVANDAQRYEGFGARLVPDVRAGVGTLGGIHAGLCHARHDHCLVVACDMPFLNGDLLGWMADQPRDFDVLTPVLSGESRQGGGFVYQTLHAIYGKRCIPAIEARIADGQRQVIGFFRDVRVRAVGEEAILNWDPDLRSFFNANTPESLELARTMAAGEEPERRW